MIKLSYVSIFSGIEAFSVAASRVEDAADAVRVSNFLKRIEDDLVRANAKKENQ